MSDPDFQLHVNETPCAGTMEIVDRVPCPTCGAQVGELCRNEENTGTIYSLQLSAEPGHICELGPTVHLARISAHVEATFPEWEAAYEKELKAIQCPEYKPSTEPFPFEKVTCRRWPDEN